MLSVLEPIRRGLSPKQVIAVIDGDYRTDKLMKDDQSDYVKILKMYSLENYLLHPDNVKNFESVEENKFNAFLIQKINEQREKLKDKIRRSVEKIKNEGAKEQTKAEIENNHKFLKMTEISEDVLREIYPYYP